MSIIICDIRQETATIPLGIEDKMLCGCCLTNVTYLLNAKNCKHLDFYEKLLYNKQKITLNMSFICMTCHSFVKKFNNFHTMMIESQNLLLNKITPFNYKTKKNELASTNHVDIEPTGVVIKTEEETALTEGTENAWNHSFETYYHQKMTKNEEIFETDDISIDEPNIDNDLSYNNEMIDDIEEYTIPNCIDNKNDGDYTFDEFIDLDKPKEAILAKGEVIPYLSTTLTGKTFKIPQLDSKEFACIVMTLTDTLEEFYKKKDSVQFKQMQYKCTKCYIGFNSKHIYEAHIMKKHTIQEEQLNNILICDICQCLILPPYTQMHYANHFIRYQCIECNKICSNLRTAKAHYMDQHDKSLKQCNLCNFTTDSGRKIRYHRQIKHNGIVSGCTSCGKVLSNPSALKYHIMTVHNTAPAQLEPCPHCNKLLKPRSLKAHIKEVHSGDVNAFCVDCKKHFKSNKCLQRHYQYHTNHIDDNLRVTCDHCGKDFKRKQYLLTHIKRKHMPVTQKYKCNQCDKYFSRQYYAVQHEKTAHSKDLSADARNHMCHYCGKGFTKAVILKAHVRIHTGERPYRCNICEATFTQSGPLGTHKRLVHSQKIKNKV